MCFSYNKSNYKGNTPNNVLKNIHYLSEEIKCFENNVFAIFGIKRYNPVFYSCEAKKSVKALV